MTEAHEEAIVWSPFDFPTVMRVSARKMRMAVAFAVNVPNHMVEGKSHQRPTCDPRPPPANLAAQLDGAPSDQAVGRDQQDKAEASQHYPVKSLHGHCFVLLWSVFVVSPARC